MRKFALLAVVTIGSGLFAGTPSMAQPSIQFGIGPDGRPQIGVRDPQQEERERLQRAKAKAKRLKPSKYIIDKLD